MRGVRSITLSLLAVAALAGCGSSSPTASPLGSALSYFPKDSPFVMSVATDPHAGAVKKAQLRLGRIPSYAFGQAALISRLQTLGINYDTDIHPLFGNPLLFGIQSGGGAKTTVLIAWVTKDGSALSSLIKKLHFSQVGTHGGAAIYQISKFTLAVDGATLLAGSSPTVVNDALDRHTSDSGMSEDDYNRDLGSLPKDGLVTAVGDLSGILSHSAKATQARSVPWVGALRSYGVAFSASPSGLSFQYTLDTSGSHLTSSELPIAPGSSPPGLAGDMPIQVGLRQPARLIAFALDASRRASPAKYAADQARMAAVRRRTGVDFQRDVLDQMGNSAALETTGHHTYLIRVDVVDPAAAARTLRKLGTSALDVLGSHRATVSAGPAGFETVHQAHRPNVLFGLVGSEFVAGVASPAQMKAFAAAPAAAAPGAQGALAFRVALPELAQLALRHAPSKAIQQLVSLLGDITGWVSSSPAALTGNATLALK